MGLNPRFPIYIVSRHRAKECPTARTLDRLKVPYRLIVERDEVRSYAKSFEISRILPAPQSYHDEYQNLDELGQEKSQGPGPARNFAWDDSMDKGFEWHWVMDDNIFDFHRNNKDRYFVCTDGTCLRVMEDFTLRYKNVAMSGPNYFMFLRREGPMPPLYLNTRIYSCNLIRNNIPFRWRGRYNEDTILSLDVLKAGWCTIEFNVFDQLKAPTQTVRGGNTDEFYSREGTLPKSLMQVKAHPDLSKLIWRYGRWHHFVDYKPFRKNPLVLESGVEVKPGTDDYGMFDQGGEQPSNRTA